jgi:dolichyl-phosphate-mannose-protein mannosyltransferase
VAGSRAGSLAGPVLIAAAALSMLYFSWGTWPDLLIDFGRDLYIPWQLAAGKTLYLDVQHLLGGPVSPYLNSLWFRLLGTSLRTLVICNVLILAVLISLLYAVFRAISDRFAAAVAGLTFVLVFAFGQLDPVGNYNFICPYRHEVTHGLLFSVAALYFLHRYLRSSRARWILGAGLCLGLALLTKAEVSVAALLSAATAFASLVWVERPRAAPALKTSAGFAICCALPFLAAVALLSRAMPVGPALDGIVGPWKASLSAAYLQSNFQLQVMGLADPVENLHALLRVSAGYVGVLSAAILSSRALPAGGLVRRAAPVGLFVLTVAALKLAPVPWPDILRPLPLVMAGAVGALGLQVLRGTADSIPEQRRRILCLSVAVFAAALLGKMLLNVHAYHYGFALAMPAALLFCVVLLDWLPGSLRRRGRDARCFQAVALAAICVAASAHVEGTRYWWGQKSVRVASGADSFLADRRGLAMNAALAEIGKRTLPGDTLAVFPEGHMLNYLARRRSPTPYIDFMPTELAYFGEEVMLDAFRKAPPDWIALVHKDTSEYGYRFFGRDYGRGFGSWIRTDYDPVTLIGAMPLQSEQFGILLLRRKP